MTEIVSSENFDQLKKFIECFQPKSFAFNASITLCEKFGKKCFLNPLESVFHLAEEDGFCIRTLGHASHNPTHFVYVFVNADKELALEKCQNWLKDNLDWSWSHTFSSIKEADDIIIDLNNILPNRGPLIPEECHVYTISKERIIEDSELKHQDYTIKALSTKEQTKMINDNWKYRSKFSTHYVTLVVEQGLCFGAFDSKNNLVAWVITMWDGAMGMLETLPDHRRKGLAQKCILALAKRHLEIGFQPYVFIHADNSPSINLFEKLGFQRHPTPIYWTEICPQNNNPTQL